ncbi:class I SAM-dependent methyltransferase [Rossellomorea vietnamensis]|uniref:Class I SAM-dependent methyltransferase n=1 Tax=Rossellomorea vietnamensis TaxID=218284 RepID=A0A5D4MI43_9BACI|nr:class I SAM-dependent methyltransferase [Rossellomorea vietnamensis]TYS01238.1 class I SAM-dependent methyltransferase [Rossellomorea vietnamensis]
MKQTFINFYNQINEEERLDAKHRNIEFLTTEHCISNYINSDQKILEVGAGTGRYSFHFAHQGHDVTALELFPSHVEKMDEKLSQTRKSIKLTPVQGDAKDLSDFQNGSFDMVLCLGPLYHIRDVSERLECISECLRVLKPNGFLFIAYINKFAAYLQNINSDKEYLQIPFEDMANNQKEFGFERDIFFFTSPEEIENELNHFKETAEVIENSATDGLAYLMRDRLNSFSDEEYKEFFLNFLKLRNEKSILGSSLHGLLIGRKKNL